MKKNPFPVDNGSAVDERDATESPTSREETAGPRARSPWTHRRPRSSRNSPRRPRDNRGTISTSPESLETPPRSPGAPSETSDANGNDSRDEILLRSPGEYGPTPDALVREIVQLHLDEVEEKTLIELNKLTDRTGMPITQENGQRRYGPPLDCDLKVPPRGSEVFVGKLPRNCYEPELVPVFEKAGKIYELRLMMDFSGTNRGYCFVHYFEPEEADRAVRELNNYEIRRGRRIGVVKSVDNCRLFVGGIPKEKNAEEIQKEMDKLTDGVVDVLVYPTSTKDISNRGYAFIEYESHKAAAMARRKLMPGKLKMWGLDIAVDWAEPKDCIPDDSKDVSEPENKCDQNVRVDQPPKAAPPRDRNRRFKNGPLSRPAIQNNGQSVMAEPFGYKGPGNPALKTPNMMISFQQQTVFNQGIFPNYGTPQPTISPQYQPVSCAQFNAQNPSLYGVSPPVNQSIPIPSNRTGFPWTGIPGVPPEIYLGQWYKDQGQQQSLYGSGKFPVMPNQWWGMNQNQGMNC